MRSRTARCGSPSLLQLTVALQFYFPAFPRSYPRSFQRNFLSTGDGSKALRAGVERGFGEQAEVQRCQVHKRRNVKEYLPDNCQKDCDRRMRNAHAMNHTRDSKPV
jgi:hypothetical protein